jgi:predicted RNA-binding protein (TIGR00451 family)
MSANGLAMNLDLEKLRTIADFQFGKGAGEVLFPSGSIVEFSKNTGKPRHILYDGDLIASLRPNDALFTLTIAGSKRLVEGLSGFSYTVTLNSDVVDFVEQGKNVFAKHVVDVDKEVRPGQEVVVIDSKKMVIAVGKAMMNRDEMLSFGVGVAVKVRRGRSRHR